MSYILQIGLLISHTFSNTALIEEKQKRDRERQTLEREREREREREYERV